MIDKDEIIKDTFANITVSLPISQIAKLHGCSKAYVSQVVRGYGLKVDKKTNTLTAPLSTIKKIFPVR